MQTKHVVSAKVTEFISVGALGDDWLDNTDELLKQYPHGCLRYFTQDLEVDKEMVGILGAIEEDTELYLTDLCVMSKGPLGEPSINLCTGGVTYTLLAHVFEWKIELYKRDFADISAFEELGWEVETNKLSAKCAEGWEKEYGWI